MPKWRSTPSSGWPRLSSSQASTTGAASERAPAYARARELDAAPLIEQIDTLARRARLRIAGVAGHASADGLTRREREVLALVAEGRTNRQIGEALIISEKTASVHMSRSCPAAQVRA